MPQELDQFKRAMIKLEIEQEALKKESDDISKERLKNVKKSLAELKEKSGDLELQWKAEKEIISKIRELKKDIERLRLDAEIKERSADLQKVAEIRYGQIPAAEKDLADEQARLRRIQKSRRILKEEVSEEDVAIVVSKWTGIPVVKMLEEEAQRLLHMEDALKKRVVGQIEAIHAVANAVRRSRAGIGEQKRPIGSFMFLGPTGVGKTELARAIAEFMFQSESAVIRLDMSEYMERHSVAKMIGSPPGYVGYEEGGQLTEMIRKRPYSVVLFDEIEKAHPETFNMLLQILDDGLLTDAKGRKVNFKNTIIVMTSNVGSEMIFEMKDLGFSDIEKASHIQEHEKITDKIKSSLKQQFKPEFLNRIDEIIVFHPLTRENLMDIAEIHIKKLAETLSEKQIKIKTSKKAKEFLVDKCVDLHYGARPLKRIIDQYILNPLSEKILESEVKEKSSVTLDVKDDKIEIESH